MKPEIFGDQSEFFHRAAQSIARRLNCDVQVVYSCMVGLDAIWNTPAHLDAVNEVTTHFNEAARHAKHLHRALSLMTEAQRRELTVAGCVTVFQVEHLADVLAQDVSDLSNWSRTRIRKGGRNPAAYDVAELIRRIFRRQRIKITLGTEPNSDQPSTDFGRAVLHSLGDFGIKAGWRGPAREAFDKQREIEWRLSRICEARRLRSAP
ncbi:hypothetical protein [Tabrizicola sp. TH137]|uniref:hypothetical protein n=1 Tax=Tabrizicola sp. TH137 TaxID=2067452 RepID=UPI00117D5991|nr:hypothetical protein [Tabrizicola sp. TH137]